MLLSNGQVWCGLCNCASCALNNRVYSDICSRTQQLYIRLHFGTVHRSGTLSLCKYTSATLPRDPGSNPMPAIFAFWICFFGHLTQRSSMRTWQVSAQGNTPNRQTTTPQASFWYKDSRYDIPRREVSLYRMMLTCKQPAATLTSASHVTASTQDDSDSNCKFSSFAWALSVSNCSCYW